MNKPLEGITEKLNKYYGNKNPLGDCLARHLGHWTEETMKRLSEKGVSYCSELMDRWNDIQDFIEKNVGNAIEIFGKQQEQQEIVKELNVFLNKAAKHQLKKDK